MRARFSPCILKCRQKPKKKKKRASSGTRTHNLWSFTQHRTSCTMPASMSPTFRLKIKAMHVPTKCTNSWANSLFVAAGVSHGVIDLHNGAHNLWSFTQHRTSWTTPASMSPTFRWKMKAMHVPTKCTDSWANSSFVAVGVSHGVIDLHNSHHHYFSSYRPAPTKH